MDIGKNMNQREALRLAEQLGIHVYFLVRTGEIGFEHPSFPRRVRINSRRKDTPRELISMLRRVAAAQPAGTPTSSSLPRR